MMYVDILKASKVWNEKIYMVAAVFLMEGSNTRNMRYSYVGSFSEFGFVGFLTFLTVPPPVSLSRRLCFLFGLFGLFCFFLS